MRARVPSVRPTSSTAASSAADSTLKSRMSAFSPSRISSRVLPTPANVIRWGSNPARSARYSSPPDTTSAPAPARASSPSTARFMFAFTA